MAEPQPKAVCYYRVSSADQQEKQSIGIQKHELSQIFSVLTAIYTLLSLELNQTNAHGIQFLNLTHTMVFRPYQPANLPEACSDR